MEFRRNLKGLSLEIYPPPVPRRAHRKVNPDDTALLLWIFQPPTVRKRKDWQRGSCQRYPSIIADYQSAIKALASIRRSLASPKILPFEKTQLKFGYLLTYAYLWQQKKLKTRQYEEIFTCIACPAVRSRAGLMGPEADTIHRVGTVYYNTGQPNGI